VNRWAFARSLQRSCWLLPLLPVPDFWITQLNYIGLYALVALGLVLLTGVAGLTSFGQAAFVGVGAYTAAYLATQHGHVALADAAALALALSVALALVLGPITLRMSGHYLPLATIAWGLALYYTMGNMDGWASTTACWACPPISCSASAGQGAPASTLIWAFGAAGGAWACTAPAGFAPGPRHPRAQAAAPPWPRPWACPPSATRW
jgi:branched-chain amino acid transport system permease protein